MTTKPPSRFTPDAMDRWRQIPQGLQFRLLNNVYCAQCRGTVGMLDHRGRIGDEVLVLKGSYGTCGERAARAIEPRLPR